MGDPLTTLFFLVNVFLENKRCLSLFVGWFGRLLFNLAVAVVGRSSIVSGGGNRGLDALFTVLPRLGTSLNSKNRIALVV